MKNGKTVILSIIAVVLLLIIAGAYIYSKNNSVRVEKDKVAENISPAKTFLAQLQKDFGINYEIKKVQKSIIISRFLGQQKILDGFSIEETSLINENKLLPKDTSPYFISKGMELDPNNSGDGTLIGQIAYKNDNIICINEGETINPNSPREAMVSKNTIFCAEFKLTDAEKKQIEEASRG